MSQFQARTYHVYIYINRPRIYTLSSLHRKNRTRTNDQVNKIIISTGKPFIQIYSRFFFFFSLCRTRRNAASRFERRCNHRIVTEYCSQRVASPSRRYQTGSSPKERRRYRHKLHWSDCDGINATSSRISSERMEKRQRSSPCTLRKSDCSAKVHEAVMFIKILSQVLPLQIYIRVIPSVRQRIFHRKMQLQNRKSERALSRLLAKFCDFSASRLIASDLAPPAFTDIIIPGENCRFAPTASTPTNTVYSFPHARNIQGSRRRAHTPRPPRRLFNRLQSSSIIIIYLSPSFFLPLRPSALSLSHSLGSSHVLTTSSAHTQI